MRCSICKTELVPGEKKKYETLSDHVSQPNAIDYPLRSTFVCPNMDCELGDSFWGPDGDFYTSIRLKEYDELPFIQGNSGAFGSFWRKVKAEEIGEKKEYGFKLWKFWLRILFKYFCDEEGDTIVRTPRIELWVKEKDSCGYTHCNGIHMFFFCIRQYHRRKRQFSETGIDHYYNELKDGVQRDVKWSSYDHAKWWRKAFVKYLKVFHSNHLKELVGNGA